MRAAEVLGGTSDGKLAGFQVSRRINGGTKTQGSFGIFRGPSFQLTSKWIGSSI